MRGPKFGGQFLFQDYKIYLVPTNNIVLLFNSTFVRHGII
jgi:hypothetical protein